MTAFLGAYDDDNEILESLEGEPQLEGKGCRPSGLMLTQAKSSNTVIVVIKIIYKSVTSASA